MAYILYPSSHAKEGLIISSDGKRRKHSRSPLSLSLSLHRRRSAESSPGSPATIILRNFQILGCSTAPIRTDPLHLTSRPPLCTFYRRPREEDPGKCRRRRRPGAAAIGAARAHTHLSAMFLASVDMMRARGARMQDLSPSPPRRSPARGV